MAIREWLSTTRTFLVVISIIVVSGVVLIGILTMRSCSEAAALPTVITIEPDVPRLLSQEDVEKQSFVEQTYETKSRITIERPIDIGPFHIKPPQFLSGYEIHVKGNVIVDSGIDATRSGSVRSEYVREGDRTIVITYVPPPHPLHVTQIDDTVDLDISEGLIQRLGINKEKVYRTAYAELKRSAELAAVRDGNINEFARTRARERLIARCKEYNPDPQVICQVQFTDEPKAAQ